MMAALKMARRMVRVVGALSALGALVVGLPWALARFVGRPLPHEVPRLSAITDALRGSSISDSVLINALACAGWVLWALVLCGLIAEGVAWARGREARRLPVAGLLQPAIRELIMSATLITGAVRAAIPASLPAVSPIVASSPLVPPVAAAAPRPEPVPPPSASSETLPSCVVAPRDSLWKLADNHLGDGMRWRDIWQLNQGKTFDGGRRFTDPNLVRPGWVLSMPADAVGLDPPVVAEPEPADEPTHEVSVPPISAASLPEVPSTSVPAAPPATREVPSVAPIRQEPVAGPADDPDHDIAPLLGGSALVAGAVIAAVNGLRRRQRKHRAPGRLIRVPEGNAARAEVNLRRAAADAPYDRLDLALRCFASCLGQRQPGPCPAIDAVSVGPKAVEILLSEEVVAPSGPFVVEAEGRAWTLAADVPDDELRPVAETQAGVAPALVTVGTIDERSVLIDLEAAPRTLVGGDREAAMELLSTLALELATTNRADDLDLVVVGELPGIENLYRTRRAAGIAEIIDGIEAASAATSASLAAERRASTFDAGWLTPATSRPRPSYSSQTDPTARTSTDFSPRQTTTTPSPSWSSATNRRLATPTGLEKPKTYMAARYSTMSNDASDATVPSWSRMAAVCVAGHAYADVGITTIMPTSALCRPFGEGPGWRR